MTNRTKIIATIGPASRSKSVLRKMILEGMNVARLNLSHGSYDEHAAVIHHIRSLAKELARPIGILFDLQGPKIRTGTLKGGKPVLLKRNSTIRITTSEVEEGSAEIVSTSYKQLSKDVKQGDRLLLDDGLIELKILSVDKNTVLCRVVNGGELKEHKGINLPGVDISAPSLTEKDKRDLDFGIRSGVDFVALSFVRSAQDIRELKNRIQKKGADIPVIAKIEKPEGVKSLAEILEITDGIMVARGDLGVEMRPEKVPMIQKDMIRKSIAANKVVITATQMLETMSSNPVPTRAEASDVANAIFDGTDAVMLSAETATGKYPVQAVQMMRKIAAEAEASSFMRYNSRYPKDPNTLVAQAVAQSAVDILNELDAMAIIVFSVSGKTSKSISKQRPAVPIYAFSPSRDVYNRLSLAWGVTPFIIPEIRSTQKLIDAGEAILREKKMVKPNNLVIVVTGLALKSGSTNMIKIHKVGRKD